MQTLNVDVVLSASITTLLILIILIFVQKKMHLQGTIFYLPIIAGLPLSYIVNQIKIPILNELFAPKAVNHTLTMLDGILWVLLVGFTEELIKFLLFIIIVAFILNRFSQKNYRNAVIVSYSVGMGFGIGEIWYLASLVLYYNVPGANLLAWLGGFGFERFFVSFAHPALFMVIIFGYRKNAFWTILALALAMVIHALYDFSVLLATIGLISSFELALIIFLELIAGFVISFVLLDTLLRFKDKRTREVQKEELLKRAKNSMQ